MKRLHEIKCVGCEGGIPVLPYHKISTLLNQVKNWNLKEDRKYILKRFAFENFRETIAFVNAIAWIANREGHHPDLEIGYNYCLVKYTTHAVNGLTQNDFISASKIDLLI